MAADRAVCRGLPAVLIEADLFRQVMFKLLDNVAKYAPSEAEVRIVARAAAHGIAIEVLDEGPGIPPGDLDRIFYKFFRIQVGDRRRAGTGLGLSSARGSSKLWAAPSSPRTARIDPAPSSGLRCNPRHRPKHLRPMTPATKILIVDDEPGIRRFLKASLETQGFHIVAAENASQALIAVSQAKPHRLILDLGLPDFDGMEVIRRIRESSALPILVLSVRNDEPSKVAALDAGADDYMVKPFGVEELLARVRAALRHRLQQQGFGPVFRLRDLAIDFIAHRVTIGDAEIKLSKREFELLRLLAEHTGQIVTHRQILVAVWGDRHGNDVEYLRVYVRQLRSKLGDDPANPRFIETEPGVGYRLTPHSSQDQSNQPLS